MKRTSLMKLLKYLKNIGIEYIELENLIDIKDEWIEEIIKCNSKERCYELLQLASHITWFTNAYCSEENNNYTKEEIEKISKIKYLGVVKDLLTSCMVQRIPSDTMIEMINNAPTDYQAKYACYVLCNPELQNFGIAKAGSNIILQSKNEYQAKYVLLALYNCSVAIALEGAHIINKSQYEYQARNILDILCNQEAVAAEVALPIAKLINKTTHEYEAELIKRMLNDKKVIEENKAIEEAEKILASHNNFDALSFYKNKLKRKIKVTDLLKEIPLT